jgi:formylglycine-generating enzyme required for sulfatase activity
MAGRVEKDCDICPEMVVIPAGSFMMGSNENSDEQPIHSVNIKRFAMGKYEVTQGQWKAVMGSNPSKFSNCGDNCPVEQVSWYDIQQYIQRLNSTSGRQYRLPSEAEWEYAARAGSTTKYSWGDSIGSNNANCDGCGSQWDNKSTAQVGSFKPNAFGLHDMHGNVWEWVQDNFHDNYSVAPTDGSAWESGGEQNSGVLRGGCWFNRPQYLRSAIRSTYSLGYRSSVMGFRLARSAR